MVTTLPAPITVRSPMVTPGQMMAPPPIQTSSPMVMGLANSSPLARSWWCMGWRCSLHVGAKEGAAAHGHGHHVQHHAVKVDEHLFAQREVVAIVAVEGWLNPEAVGGVGEELPQKALAFFGLVFAAFVQGLEQEARLRPFLGQLRVQSVVELAREHFLFFCFHRGGVCLGKAACFPSPKDLPFSACF